MNLLKEGSFHCRENGFMHISFPKTIHDNVTILSEQSYSNILKMNIKYS